MIKCLRFGFLLSVLSNLAQAQVDSTFVKGELKLEDGFYILTKDKFRNPLLNNPFLENDFFFIDLEPVLATDAIDRLEIVESNFDGDQILVVYFREQHWDDWRMTTQNNISKSIVLILQNEIIDISQIMSKIENGTSAIFAKDRGVSFLKKIKEKLEK